SSIPPATPPLFPYTTLFRSPRRAASERCDAEEIFLDPARERLPSGEGLPLHAASRAHDDRAVGDKRYAIRVEKAQVDHRGLWRRSEEHTSELQSRVDLVCRL